MNACTSRFALVLVAFFVTWSYGQQPTNKSSPHTPLVTYKGKTVAQWLEAVKTGGPVEASDSLGAWVWFGEHAESALPELEVMAKTPDEKNRWRESFALAGVIQIGRFVGRFIDKTIADLEDQERREWAYKVLQGIAVDGPPALFPAIERRLANPDSPNEIVKAFFVLGSAGVHAVPSLARLLASDNPQVRQKALQNLAQRPAFAVPAVAELSGLVAQPETGSMAIQLLGAIGRHAAPAIPQLLAVLQNPEIKLLTPNVPPGQAPLSPNQVHSAVIDSLGRIGVNDPAAVERLAERLRSDDKEIRRAAAMAILRIAPMNQPDLFLAAYEQLRADEIPGGPDGYQRDMAFRDGTVRIGRALAPAVMRLWQEGKLPDGLSIEILTEFQFADAVPRLLDLLRAVPERPIEVFDPLFRINQRRSEIVSVLVEMLESPDLKAKQVAFEGLYAFRHHATAAAPKLVALIDQPATTPEIRQRALFTLGSLGPAVADQVVERLPKMAKDQAEFAQLSHVALLVGPRAATWVFDQTKSSNAEVARGSMTLLVQMGHEASPVVGELERRLNEAASRDDALLAAETLLETGPAGFTVLEQRLSDANPTVRLAILEVVARNFRDADEWKRPLLSELRRAIEGNLESDDPSIRQAAYLVLSSAPSQAIIPIAEERHRNGNPDEKAMAAATLVLSGRRDAALVRDILPAIENPRRSVETARALRALDAFDVLPPECIPVLEKIAFDAKADQRTTAPAIQLLAKCGRDALPVLLRNFERSRRAETAEALWQIEKHPVATRQLALGGISYSPTTRTVSDPYLQKELQVLGDMGVEAKRALPALWSLLDQLPLERDRPSFEAIQMRILTAETIWKISRHPAAANVLVEILTQPELQLRRVSESPGFIYRMAGMKLRNLGEGAPPLRPLLIGTAQRETGILRLEAARLLWQIERNASALAYIRRTLSSEFAEQRANAATFLAEYPDEPEFLPMVLAQAERDVLDPDPGMRRQAFQTIWQAAPARAVEIQKSWSE